MRRMPIQIERALKIIGKPDVRSELTMEKQVLIGADLRCEIGEERGMIHRLVKKLCINRVEVINILKYQIRNGAANETATAFNFTDAFISEKWRVEREYNDFYLLNDMT